VSYVFGYSHIEQGEEVFHEVRIPHADLLDIINNERLVAGARLASFLFFNMVDRTGAGNS
jgi:hypothetical protein